MLSLDQSRFDLKNQGYEFTNYLYSKFTIIYLIRDLFYL